MEEEWWWWCCGEMQLQLLMLMRFSSGSTNADDFPSRALSHSARELGGASGVLLLKTPMLPGLCCAVSKHIDLISPAALPLPASFDARLLYPVRR